MSSSKPPIYNSFSVQRATRINILESVRLQQTLRYIEQAKIHQQRLTNRDIRLISMNIAYIQSCSGHSLDTAYSELDAGVNRSIEKTPCFMYGERIWSRKRKRLQRPTSALEHFSSECDSSNSVVESNMEQIRHRHVSVSGFRPSLSSQKEHDFIDKDESELELLGRNSAFTSRARVTPHQIWEDGVSEVTKKILSAQNRAQSAKRRSLYQSSDEVMSSQASRNVRGLLRKIRITSVTPV